MKYRLVREWSSVGDEEVLRVYVRFLGIWWIHRTFATHDGKAERYIARRIAAKREVLAEGDFP